MTLPNFNRVHDPDTGFVQTAEGVVQFFVGAAPAMTFDVNGMVSEDADAFLNFSSRTLDDGKNAIRGVGLDFEDVTGWIAFTGNSEDDAFRYSAYFAPTTANSAKFLGVASIPTLASGASVNLMNAFQAIATIQSGATVTTRGGNATAGIHPVWAKIAGDVGATWDSGARAAPIWADIQINGVDVSAEEVFHIFASAGGSAARALIRMEDQMPVNFLETDKALGNRMLASTGYDTTNASAQAGFLVVDLNGTKYGIPLMSAT